MFNNFGGFALDHRPIQRATETSSPCGSVSVATSLPCGAAPSSAALPVPNAISTRVSDLTDRPIADSFKTVTAPGRDGATLALSWVVAAKVLALNLLLRLVKRIRGPDRFASFVSTLAAVPFRSRRFLVLCHRTITQAEFK